MNILPRERTLSPRQLEVISMIASGLEKGQVAHFLGISEYTVDKHTRRAFAKLGAKSSANAVFIAMSLGIPLSEYTLAVTQIRPSTGQKSGVC